MYSAGGSAVLLALGFPIRESADQRLFSASPRLIAAVHALHRLLVPRHPPCALPILTVIRRFRKLSELAAAPGDTRLSPADESADGWHGCAVFKVREEAHAPDWSARSLKAQQHAPAGTGRYRPDPRPGPPPGAVGRAAAMAGVGCTVAFATGTTGRRVPGSVDVREPDGLATARDAPPAHAGAPVLELP